MSIKLTVSERVSGALSDAFPKSNTTRALNKYVSVLEELLTKAIIHGRTPDQQKLDLYSLSLHALTQRGGQIGPQRVRLHKWLSENKLELVVSVQKGSNLTRKVSQVKLSPLVQITHGHLAEHATPISPHALTLVPEADEATKLGFIDSVYPELKTYANIKELHQHFDASYVNVKSLLGYIKWLEKGATDLDKERRTRDITQATHIVNVASALDGIFLQKRKVSPFGRTYYEGISAQSVRKSLRQAMFGGCWEYDIRSAVISWKVGMGSTLLAEVTPQVNHREAFKNSIYFIENKVSILAEICSATFTKDDAISDEIKKRMVKQAVTAISFGARERTTGWLKNGSWHNPAIVDIIKNPNTRRRFLACAPIRGFISEQRALDELIYTQCTQLQPDLLKNPLLKTESGRSSKSLVIAYLYQHYETAAMKVVKEIAESNNRKVIASIHDAVILDRKLSAELKYEIELRMREETGIPYWHLAGKELREYTYISDSGEEFMREHAKRLKEEQALAVEIESVLAQRGIKLAVERPTTDFSRPTPTSTVNYPYDIHAWSVENGTAEYPQACFRQATDRAFPATAATRETHQTAYRTDRMGTLGL